MISMTAGPDDDDDWEDVPSLLDRIEDDEWRQRQREAREEEDAERGRR